MGHKASCGKWLHELFRAPEMQRLQSTATTKYEAAAVPEKAAPSTAVRLSFPAYIWLRCLAALDLR